MQRHRRNDTAMFLFLTMRLPRVPAFVVSAYTSFITASFEKSLS